jgi:hypothetical protein
MQRLATLSEISQGLEGLHEVLEGAPGLKVEFLESRGEFFGGSEAALAAGAELRHLEWFFLERPSSVLGAVPIAALANDEELSLPSGVRAIQPVLATSIAGAFEILRTEAADSWWAQDLFTLQKLLLASSPVFSDLQSGDLVVGRVYPIGDGSFQASMVAWAYRSPAILAAVRADLAGMRRVRRGVLRIQQLELERLFHAHEAALTARPAEEQFQRTELEALGLNPRQVDTLLAEVRAAACERASEKFTDVLNRLAFETHVDLERARETLLRIWYTPRTFPGPAPESPDVSAALAAFDRGRKEGADLELLFKTLELELGLDQAPGEDSDSLDGVPDFPGVVGAMVEEFLWEVEREHGQPAAQRFEGLRLLGTYAADIGMFEELGRSRLIDFSTRWLLEETHLAPPELQPLLEGLRGFCAWAEDYHELPLRRDFGAVLAEAWEPILRLCASRPYWQRGRKGWVGVVIHSGNEALELRPRAGEPRRAVVDCALASLVRPGDLVVLGTDNDEVQAIYPSQLAEVLSEGASGWNV